MLRIQDAAVGVADEIPGTGTFLGAAPLGVIDPYAQQVDFLPGVRVGGGEEVVVGAQTGAGELGDAKGLGEIGADVQFGGDCETPAGIDAVDDAGVVAGTEEDQVLAAKGSGMGIKPRRITVSSP